MPSLDEFRRPGPQPADAQAPWPVRVSGTADAGEATTPPHVDATADYGVLLESCGLDPEMFEVVEPVRFNRWQGYDGRWMRQDKFSYRRKGKAPSTDEVLTRLATWRPRTKPAVTVREGAFVSPIGDTQMGKPDGDGSEGTFGRVLSGIEQQVAKMRAGLKPRQKQDLLVLPWLGDCIEGIWSQGGALRARLDLTLTEQVRVYRRLMARQLEAFAPWTERIVVPVIPGNHDEGVRTGNKMSSTYDDSWAIEGASAVQDAIGHNVELAGRVEFVFPAHDHLTVTVDVAGTYVGMAHGHQFAGGADGWRKWWNDQAGGRTAIGTCDLLLAAHLHHLRVIDHGDGRLFVQVPALDGGSTWFKHRKGEASPSRMVSFWTGGGQVWGLDPLQVRTSS